MARCAPVDLLAQLADEDVHRAVAPRLAPAPEPLHELVARDHLAPVLGHNGGLDLAGVVRDGLSTPVDAVRLLVDGGISDNVPVDVARAMGADIVIAVNLGTPLMKREELTSVLGVTEEDKVYAGASLSFDVSVEEMWAAFLNGAELLVGSETLAKSGPLPDTEP